jgi:hypothetical protein
MPTRAVFRCQFCDAVPDHGTQRSLAGQVTERMFGEYLDALPGRWLVWNGGGPLGPRRYACREHRGDLVAYLRYHYATVAAQVWKMPPYPQRWPDEKRPRMGGSMGVIKFGLRGGLLQDRVPAKPDGEPVPPADEAPPPPVETTATAGTPTTPADAAPATGDAAPATGDAARSTEGETTEPDDGFPDEDLFPPGALYGPAEPDTPEERFPPGELFLPTDGVFASEGDEGDEGPWPSGDMPADDDGPWPPEPDAPAA